MSDIPFDAIASLVAILIGVPAVVVQSIAPEVRLIVARRWRWLLLETGIPVILALGFICLGIVRQNIDPADIPAVDLLPPEKWIWVLVFAALFIIATYIAMRIPHRYGRRDIIVRALEREIGRRVMKKGRLVEHSLEDLIDLGRQSEAGQDKELVLQALYRLVVKTCDNNNYAGDALETLVQSLVNILASNSVPGTPQNFCTAMEILHRIVTTTDRASSAPMPLVDGLWAVRELSALGQAALLHVGPKEIEHTMMRCIQALGVMANRHTETVTEVSQALFEVGVVAIEKNQMLIAIAALDKLITLAQMCRPARNELAADMLGLVAHFWIASYTAHTYVQSRLAEICGAIAEPLPAALEMASRHCVQTIQFQTSDNLNQMLHDLQRAYAGTAWQGYIARASGKRSAPGSPSRFTTPPSYPRRG